MIPTQKRTLALLIGAACVLPAMAEDSVAFADSINEVTIVDAVVPAPNPAGIVGGVTVVNVEAMQKKDHTNYALDNMQGYVGGWNGASLWAMDGDNDGGYLTIVDGVPRSADNVLPSEIKDITFLKSAAATVLYGSRAAKGAIVITTKRGESKPLSISVNANAGWNVAKSYPEYLGSAEYMTLYNRARELDGHLDPTYSAADIFNTASGLNPYRYPNVDFYSKDYISKVKNRYDVTAQISGGNNRARYYTNINYYYMDDVFKIGQAKDNNVNRLSVRGNVDVSITDWISAWVNTAASFYNSRSAKNFQNGDNSQNYWQVASTFRPNRIAPLIPLSMIDPNALGALEIVNGSNNIIDGKYFLSGTSIDQTNIFANFYAAGYNKYVSRNFQFDAGLNIELDRVLKGLSFRAQFAADYATSYNTAFDNNYAVFIPTWSNYSGHDAIVGITQEGIDEKSGVQNVSSSTDNQTISFNAAFNYRNTFNKVHNLDATVLASGWQQTLTGVYHRTSNATLGFRAAYDYAGRYFADFQGAAIHSAKLAPGHRNAFSPSLTLGWRISEDFFKGSKTVNDLTLSASGSIVHSDLDIADYYMWRGSWGTGGWFSWADGRANYAYYPSRGENLDLTFIKRKEFSATLQGAFLQRMIQAKVDFFINEMNGLLVENPTTYPDHLWTYYPDASFLPYLNYNNNRRMGVDFAVNFTKSFGEVNLDLGVVGAWYNTKATRRDEKNEFAYQNREGKPVDGLWGYQSAGLFKDDADIAAWYDQSALGEVKPGDIKYVDQNGDKIIDSKDQVYLAKAGWYGAPFSMGVNLTVNWRGFTFFALGTGNWGGHGSLAGNSYYYATGTDKYSAEMRNAWTPETAATATLPRLTTTAGANNTVASDYWIYSTDAFRLAKLQLSYDLPASLMRKCFLSEAQVYVSGSNLFTFGKNRKILDTNIGSEPAYRLFNVGFTVKI
ncbi:MAG: SusC/RagA family TonB-linked outer membrane protein [Muribaculaceae bacterium]|nr:SusC/RagA family TonB-linked outer membrane protein [Muribaculaceae bacterium]